MGDKCDRKCMDPLERHKTRRQVISEFLEVITPEWEAKTKSLFPAIVQNLFVCKFCKIRVNKQVSAASKNVNVTSSDSDDESGLWLTSDDDNEPKTLDVKCVSGSSANIVFRRGMQELKKVQVARWFRCGRVGRLEPYMMEKSPMFPKAGEVFVCKVLLKSTDYLFDGYTGFKMNSSSKRSDSKGSDMYWTTHKCRDEDKVAIDFTKIVYRMSNPDPANNFVIIHYSGNEKLWKPRSHKNSKSKGKIFTQNTGECKEQIKEKVKACKTAPHKMYEQLKKEQHPMKYPEQDESSPANLLSKYERDGVDIVRDSKQVENIKYKMGLEGRVLRDQIFAVLEMAKTKQLGDFIIRHTEVPYVGCILADPSALELTKNVLKESGKDLSLPQLLTYDTTFELCDAYVSVLIARNIFLEGDPIYPVAFLLHDRKVQKCHTEFFREVSELLDLSSLQDNVPICVDREEAITNAISSVLPGANIVYCLRHIKTNVDFKVRELGGKKEDVVVYKNHMREMLAAETEEELDEVWSQRAEYWSEPFLLYAEKSLKPDIKRYAARYVVSKFPAFADKEATNNLSESFNACLKRDQGWAVIRYDAAVLAFFNRQLESLDECRLAFSPGSGGRRVLKEQYLNRRLPFKIPPYLNYPSAEFVKLFKANVEEAEVVDFNRPCMTQSRVGRARLACREGLVTLESRCRSFVVLDWNDHNKRYAVHRGDNGLLICTCKGSDLCWHRASVVYAIGLEITEDTKTYSLSELHRKTRTYKGLTGKKFDKERQITLDVIPAPDSQLSRRLAENDHDDEIKDKRDEQYSNKCKDINDTKPTSKRKGKTSKPEKPNDASRNRDDNEIKPLVYPPEEDLDHPDSTYRHDPDNCLSPAPSCGLGTRVETPDKYRIANTPKSVKIPAGSLYKSLSGRIWLDDAVIDDSITKLIKIHRRDEIVSYVATGQLRRMDNESAMQEDVITFAARYQGLNSDVTLVVFNTKKHWYLGAIFWNEKKMLIVNSWISYITDYRHQFWRLLRFVAASYVITGLPLRTFDVDAWTFIIGDDVPQQDNADECGVHAILNAYSIISQNRWFDVNADKSLYRRWIYWMLTQEESGSSWLRPYQKVAKINVKDKPKLYKHVESFMKTVNESSLSIENGSGYNVFRSALRLHRGDWNKCDDSSCSTDESESEDQAKCISCRRWIHRKCTDESFGQTYFFCTKCRSVKVNYVDHTSE